MSEDVQIKISETFHPENNQNYTIDLQFARENSVTSPPKHLNPQKIHSSKNSK